MSIIQPKDRFFPNARETYIYTRISFGLFSSTFIIGYLLKLYMYTLRRPIKFPAFASVHPMDATSIQRGSPEPLERCPIYLGPIVYFKKRAVIRNIGLHHVTTDTYLI